MRVARASLNHQRLARHAVQDGDALDRREPALINLPISLASIPLLDPIITPLIAGKGPESTTAPAPAPSPSNTSSGGNSGGNGSGSSGSGSSSSGSGASGSSGNSGGGNSSGGNSGGGNSGGGNSGGGSGNTSGGNTSNSDSSNGTGASSGPSPGNALPSSPAGNSGSSSSGSSGSSGPSPSPSTSGSHSGTGTGSSSDSSIPVVVSASAGGHTGSTFASSSREQSDDTPHNAVNVGSDPSSVSVSSSSNHAATIVSASHNAPSTVGSSSSGSSGSTTSGSGNGTSSPGGEAPQSGTSHGLSTGAIAGIIVTAIVFWTILFVFCLRRRYIARRAQRRTKWAGKGISSDTMNWSQTLMSHGTMSARSSFATTYDISNSGNSFRGEVPAMPVMAEIRDTHSPGLMTHTQQVDCHDVSLVAPPSPLLINLDDDRERRNSTSSKRSSSSSVDPYSQYLVIRQPPGAVISGNGSLPLTPMSVRPFSPSEAFTFPKPPKTPGEEMSQWIENDTTIPSPAINPFIDTQAEFEETEVIRRPFMPTLDDEMRVSAGERVRIVQVYSDGWALVERRAVDDKKGKGTSLEEIIRGLIPVDCFREAGEDLPAFLAAKRVSDYHDATTLRA